jgi:uncharacterized protein with PIN domain
MKFLADRTVGKLAKWLRIIGFDTRYDIDACSGRSSEGSEPDRILLTRSRRAIEKTSFKVSLLIRSDHIEKQLRQVIRDLKIDKAGIRPFSRCIRCNTRIRPVERSAVFGRVPDYIWENCQDFRQCENCSRIYWEGTHIERGKERIEKLFSEGARVRDDGQGQ